MMPPNTSPEPAVAQERGYTPAVGCGPALRFPRASTRGTPSPLSLPARRLCRPRGRRSGSGLKSASGPERLYICTAAPRFTPVSLAFHGFS